VEERDRGDCFGRVHKQHVCKNTNILDRVHQQDVCKNTNTVVRVHQQHVCKNTNTLCRAHQQHVCKNTNTMGRAHQQHVCKNTNTVTPTCIVLSKMGFPYCALAATILAITRSSLSVSVDHINTHFSQRKRKR
jgi:hypothetical protein